MNINAASHYIKLDYKVRRSSWEPEEYLYELAGMLYKNEVHINGVWDHESKSIKDWRSVSDSGYIVILEDLLADDWELIGNESAKEV